MMFPGDRMLAAAAALLMALLAADAAAHPAAERYIPIGQSPGLSGGKTYIGRIRSAEKSSYTLVVASEEHGRQTVRVSPTSDVWIDRSKRRRPSVNGTFDDCRPGRRVEILMRAGSDEADWVKVEGR